MSLSLSAGLIGFVEASGRSTAEKNRLCPPNTWFDTPFDWMRHLLTGMRTELEWQEAPDVVAWLESSRLNLMKGLDQSPDKAAVAELQVRFLTALFPALERFEELTRAPRPPSGPGCSKGLEGRWVHRKSGACPWTARKVPIPNGSGVTPGCRLGGRYWLLPHGIGGRVPFSYLFPKWDVMSRPVLLPTACCLQTTRQLVQIPESDGGTTLHGPVSVDHCAGVGLC